MNPQNHASLVEEYRRAKAALLAEYPELAFDNDTLTDTLEGLSDATEIVARIVRQHLETEAQAEGLGGLIKTYSDRKGRMEDRAAALKAMAFKLMQAMGERTIKRPEFTLSIAAAKPSVIITDEGALPAIFKRFKVEPDKVAIFTAIKDGGHVPGAALSNGAERLTVRVK